MLYLLFLISTLSILFSERGDLLDYTFKEDRDAVIIQSELEGYVSDIGASSIITPNAIYDVELYSIIYETIDQFGIYTQASGLVAIPSDINYAYPLYLFGHGTQIRRSSAPSMGGFNPLNQWLSSEGFIYLEPDYLGLGESIGMHPYQIKEPYGTSVVDMIRAVRNFGLYETDQFICNDQLFLAGYSEGGYATMAVHQIIERDYLDEFSITFYW